MPTNDSKSFQAAHILNQTYNDVNNLLQELNIGNSGYLTISELLGQIQEDIQDTQKRAGSETIRIGILGGRGSGKSTLANALMGAELLPDSAIIFCTSIPTTIQYGKNYSLTVISDIEQNNYSASNLSSSLVKDKLRVICRESENPQNEKKISKITLDVPNIGLSGKEIVDLPGFTKGNPLHQAFAESYAKYYCDACLVLINNAESVEIKSQEGLEALVQTFENRLNATAFVINKCDESPNVDMDYLEGNLQSLLNQKEHYIFRVSAKNSLKGNRKQFQWNQLRDWLDFLTSKKVLILVKAFLDRLISNLSSLRDLCKLSEGDLNSLHKNLNNLLNIEFQAYIDDLWKNLEGNEILPDSLPEINLSHFDLPKQLETSPFEYGRRLSKKISEQSIGILDNFVQAQQANIFNAFNDRFEKQITGFNQAIEEKVKTVESKFGLSASIQPPKVRNLFRYQKFSPSDIEKLRPTTIKLWLEKLLPSSLVRDLIFWQSPLTIRSGVFSMKLGIPIGIKPAKETVDEIKINIENQAVQIMNEFIYESLSFFFNELAKESNASINVFTNEWRKCLQDYIQRVEVAKRNASSNVITKIDKFITQTQLASDKVSKMIYE